LFVDVIDDQMRLSRVGSLVQAHWTALERRWRGVDVDTFVVMPNHIHGIVWLARAGQAPPLPTLIGSFKSGVSRRLRQVVWQRSFYDRVIRNETELSGLRQYVADNPLRWALDRENPANR
jgi:putative transposase